MANNTTGTKTVRFPVTWEVFGMVELEVPIGLTNEEIIDWFNEHIDDIGLPDGSEYVDGSFKSSVDKEDAEWLDLYQKGAKNND